MAVLVLGVLAVGRPFAARYGSRWWACLFICLLSWTDAAFAQQAPGLLSGVVRDTRGRPVSEVLVALDANTTSQRVTQSDTGGQFRFERVARGSHELVVAGVGYRTEFRPLDMPEGSLEVTIILEDIMSTIDTMRVQARRTGIFGTVIARDGFRPLARAEVNVIGISRRSTTGSDGQFAFGAVRRGSHVVHVQRQGYQSRILSVVVPRDSAVELALVLDSTTLDTQRRLSIVLAEFDSRRRWMVSGNAAVVARHELAGRGDMSLWDALRYAPTFLTKGLVLDEEACVYIDGQFKQMLTAKDIPAGSVEAVEIYGTGADITNTVTFRHGNLPSRLPQGAFCGTSTNPAGVRTAAPLDRRVMNFGRGSLANRARVEAIVVWLRR